MACVVAVEQRGSFTPDRPRALLLAAGAHDPFHPLVALQGTPREAVGRHVAPFETVRDRRTGAVRRLALSGACEHAGEVYDAALLGQVAPFVEAGLVGRPVAATGVRPRLHGARRSPRGAGS